MSLPRRRVPAVPAVSAPHLPRMGRQLLVTPVNHSHQASSSSDHHPDSDSSFNALPAETRLGGSMPCIDVNKPRLFRARSGPHVVYFLTAMQTAPEALTPQTKGQGQTHARPHTTCDAMQCIVRLCGMLEAIQRIFAVYFNQQLHGVSAGERRSGAYTGT